MAISGHTVAVYTNEDGGQCGINNIQIIDGLNRVFLLLPMMFT
jgi:hypothetical protein